jgi:hypothetical protein
VRTPSLSLSFSFSPLLFMAKRKFDDLSCMGHFPARLKHNFSGTTCEACGQRAFYTCARLGRTWGAAPRA